MNEKKKIIFSLLFPLLFLLSMWIFYFSFSLLTIEMSEIGISPRKAKGLMGIFLSPFAHGNISHIVSNTFSFFVLASALFYFYRKIAYKIFFINWLFSGFLLWIGGRVSSHIGASGLIYGLAFFLTFSGFFRKKKPLIALSFVVVIIYGGMVWGILPQDNSISWDGHLFGAISGISLAWFFRKNSLEVTNQTKKSTISTTSNNFYVFHYEFIPDEKNEKY